MKLKKLVKCYAFDKTIEHYKTVEGMLGLLICFTICLDTSFTELWPQGVVHYTINKKDYDIHSQDAIMSTLSAIQKEICLKFFNTPLNYSVNEKNKILYISNPDKRKNCPPEHFNFTNTIVDMPIGYKCISEKDITRVIVDMLRASVENTVKSINSFDLIKKFKEQDEDPSRPTLISPKDRNYINAHYHAECGSLSQRPTFETRRFSAGAVRMSVDNEAFYKEKIWPLGLIMYGVEDRLRYSPFHTALKYAMTTIELSSCVVFQEVVTDSILKPKNLLWFASEGEESPELGFKEGNQSISIMSMTNGAPGHTAHTLGMLLRVLGIPMMSNRYDRDNYITVNWKYVEKGKERYLEKLPEVAWLADQDGGKLPYCFESASHAPANYMCGDCSLTSNTVHPIQDHLWQRTLSIGHRSDLAPCDVELIKILYSNECHNRYMSNNNK